MRKSSPRNPLINKRMSALREKANTSKGNNQNNEVNNQEPRTAGTYADKPKWTDVAGVGVNLILMVFTAFLYRSAVKQSEIAEKSANAAIEAVREQKLNDSLANFRDSVTSYNDSINIGKRFALDSVNMNAQQQSVQAQIRTLQQTHEQFEKDNEPYLKIINQVMKFEIGKRLYVVYDIVNLGQRPVKGYVYSAAIKLVAKRDSLAFVKDPFRQTSFIHEDINYNYYAKESPAVSVMPTNHFVTKKEFDAVEKGELLLYFIGEVYYQNAQNEKWKNYKFCIQFVKSGTTDASSDIPSRFIYNENTYLRKEPKISN